MVVAVVAGLECFHSSNDWHIRGICNTALARLVIENAKIFVEEDNLGKGLSFKYNMLLTNI